MMFFIILAIIFVAMGISTFNRKEAVKFWSANTKAPKVNDVKGYNSAVAKLFIGFGLAILLTGFLGFYVLDPDGIGGIIMVFMIFFEALALMLIYVLVIEKRYRIG